MLRYITEILFVLISFRIKNAIKKRRQQFQLSNVKMSTYTFSLYSIMYINPFNTRLTGSFFSDPLQEQSLLPLLSGITDDITILPLPSGKTYSLLALAVDHVGNRQPVNLNQVITVDFTPPARTSW